MKWLSLFDGMSCGRIALERAGIPVAEYHASEIDKYAQIVSKANYPDIIRHGDVRNLNPNDFKGFHGVIGGSPCQCLSFAGKRKGMSTKDNIQILTLDQYLELKEQDFEFEGQSYLFWEYIRILKVVKPKYFLLENVIMSKEWEDVISSTLGGIYPECVSQFDLFGDGRLEPIEINSALVSAQNRRRLYWTNIPGVCQPEDKGILLKDILETAETDFNEHVLSSKAIERIKRKKYSQPQIEPDKTGTINTKNNSGQLSVDSGTTLIKVPVIKSHGKLIHKPDKAQCLDANYFKGPDNHGQRTGCIIAGKADLNGHDIIKRVYSPEGKSPTLTAVQGGNQEPKVACGAIRGRYLVDGKRQDHKELTAGKTKQLLEIRDDEKTNTLTTVQKDNVLVCRATVQKNSEHSTENKSTTLTAAMGMGGGNVPMLANEEQYKKYKGKYLDTNDRLTWRKLTPLECERLQTVPDNYTAHVSNSQRYKMLGNGWTVDVIAHIMKHIKQGLNQS